MTERTTRERKTTPMIATLLVVAALNLAAWCVIGMASVVQEWSRQ